MKIKTTAATALFAVLSTATAQQIPSFPSGAGGQPTGNLVAADAGNTGYYLLPNGDLIGPDGKPVPMGADGQPIGFGSTTGAQGQMPSTRAMDQRSRVSPGAGMELGSPFSERVGVEINRQPEVVYNPDGTVTVKPLKDMADPFAVAEELVVPLTPEQIRRAKRVYQENMKAQSMPFHGNMPAPISSQVTLDLSPNATPPVVRVIPGSGSVVSFRDITGAAWPVVSYKSFNGTDFTVSQPIAGSNMITVAANKNYSVGNIAVVLQNHPSPILLSTLSTQAKEIDAKLDVQIPIMGPQAKQSGIPTRNPTGKDLIDALYGILPEGSKEMEVAGARAKAWLTNGGELIITGALQIVSPSPLERTGMGDGFYAYRMQQTRVILATQNGTERKIVLKERR